MEFTSWTVIDNVPVNANPPPTPGNAGTWGGGGGTRAMCDDEQCRAKWGMGPCKRFDIAVFRPENFTAGRLKSFESLSRKNKHTAQSSNNKCQNIKG